MAKKSTLLIVLLKADKLMKLTEVGRLFHALMTFGEDIHSDSAVTTYTSEQIRSDI